jgi:hypothetical protein
MKVINGIIKRNFFINDEVKLHGMIVGEVVVGENGMVNKPESIY